MLSIFRLKVCYEVVIEKQTGQNDKRLVSRRVFGSVWSSNIASTGRASSACYSDPFLALFGPRITSAKSSCRVLDEFLTFS